MGEDYILTYILTYVCMYTYVACGKECTYKRLQRLTPVPTLHSSCLHVNCSPTTSTLIHPTYSHAPATRTQVDCCSKLTDAPRSPARPGLPLFPLSPYTQKSNTHTHVYVYTYICVHTNISHILHRVSQSNKVAHHKSPVAQLSSLSFLSRAALGTREQPIHSDLRRLSCL